MITMYLCFLAGGAVLPFVSFLFGSLGHGSETDFHTDFNTDLHTDFHGDFHTDLHADIHTDVDTGTHLDAGTDIHAMFSLGLLPTSLMSLSALAITFGAVGGVMSYTGKGKIITLIVAVIAGYIASVIIQTLIKSLKKIQVNNYGINENELLLYDGKVIDAILPGKLGTVSFVTLNNELVSYPARCIDENRKLETGRIVKAIEIKKGVFLVEAKNKYE